MISESAGFSFKEEELSPELRKEITDVATQLDNYHRTRADLNEKEAKENKESCGGGWCCLSGLLGIAVLIWGIATGKAGNVLDNWGYLVTIVGIVVAITVFGLWLMSKGSSLAGERGDVASLWSSIEGRVDELAKEVETELSAVQEAKVRPTVRHVVIDFARIIEAAKGRGIILDKVECPHCGAAITIPVSGEHFKCEYCGKTVYATNVFDRLKDILSPTKNSRRQDDETD
jgi:ribosomal protein S27AE